MYRNVRIIINLSALSICTYESEKISIPVMDSVYQEILGIGRGFVREKEAVDKGEDWDLKMLRVTLMKEFVIYVCYGNHILDTPCEKM